MTWNKEPLKDLVDKYITCIDVIHFFSQFSCLYMANNYNDFKTGLPNGDSKFRFHAGFSHKSRPEIAWNSCSLQFYPITLNARLIIHATFSIQFPFSCSKSSSFHLWGGAKTSLDSKQPYKLLNVWNILRPLAYKVVALKKENNVWYILKLVRLHAFL